MYSWASYLFSGSPAPTNGEEEKIIFKTTLAEDEWMLVDARGSSPHRMEENPLENLLIEHSSMSVYGDSKENISQVETAQPSKTRASAKKDVVKKGDNNKDGELSEAFIKQELKVEFLKRVRENLPRQKARKAKEHRDNSKKQMHRLNKTPVRPVLSQRNVTRKFISQPGKRC